ncbi:MAG: GntR family transcriptional regulator [Candidatus Izemoplasmatales bacterium]|nr:GntR family transcriptional regulator [Candidatus Izemoplasmatales bacterium]MDY0138655.1 GntR family transcriptional regulator [Candidatus Izemoplasmatales bacterium]
MKNRPIYKIIEQDLRIAILEGRLKQGDMIPSETELCAKYDVARMTVRQAINNLLVDGYIYRHKGRGTFVTFNKKEIKKQDSSSFLSFTNEMKLLDSPVSTTLLNIQKTTADEMIARRLQIHVGDNIYYVERLRSSDNIPLAYERLYLPYNMYGVLDEKVFNGSFYRFVQEDLGWRIRNCEYALEARGVPKKVAELLHQQEGEPALYLNSVTYLENGRAFVYTRYYFHGEHFRFKDNYTRKNGSNDHDF